MVPLYPVDITSILLRFPQLPVVPYCRFHNSFPLVALSWIGRLLVSIFLSVLETILLQWHVLKHLFLFWIYLPFLKEKVLVDLLSFPLVLQMPISVYLSIPISFFLLTHSMVLPYDWSSGWTFCRSSQIPRSFLLLWFSLVSSISWLLLSCLIPFELVLFQLLPQVLEFLPYWSHIWIVWNISCTSLWSSKIRSFFLSILLLS